VLTTGQPCGREIGPIGFAECGRCVGQFNFVPSAIMSSIATLVSRPLDQRRAAAALAGLSAKEREVLALMAEGRSNAAIASHLIVGAGAVEKHVASIFAKLGLRPSPDDHRRVLAVLVYLSTGPRGV
jgi:DNA-binding NarL/FixJ family response regulator